MAKHTLKILWCSHRVKLSKLTYNYFLNALKKVVGHIKAIIENVFLILLKQN